MTAADLLSLARIPLGGAFLFVAADTKAAFFVLATAALSDVLDGWVARRSSTRAIAGVRHRGDWLDPLCDKIFAVSVVVGLLMTKQPSIPSLLAMMAREQLQLIAIILMRLSPVLRRAARHYEFRAHLAGKATTVAQFVASAALLAEHPIAAPLCLLAGILGVISFAIYVQRIRALLPGRTPPDAPAASG